MANYHQNLPRIDRKGSMIRAIATIKQSTWKRNSIFDFFKK